MADQNPLQGAMGGWWNWSSIGVPTGGPSSVCRVEAIASGFIAEFRVIPGDSASAGAWVSIDYTIRLRYQSASGIVELVSYTPVPDPALGHTTSGVARAGWTMPWRFALVFRCSTWDAGTSTYAADGFAKLFVNSDSTPLLQATGVTIPRRLNAGAVRYTVAALADGDRMWARSVASVPPTTSEGGWVTGPPTSLLWFDDFTTGTYPDWTAVDLYPGGGFTAEPHLWPDCGGDNGRGISIYGCGPNDTGGLANHSYAGLTRVISYPPDTGEPPDPEEPPPGGGGGQEPPIVAPSYDLDVRYIRRLRRAPHVANENTRVFYRRFELDLERGQGLATGQGADPMVLLRISGDGGQTWGEELRMAAGRLGEYTQRVIARRLGHARDTVFEVVVSDPIAWSLVGAWLDLEPGAH